MVKIKEIIESRGRNLEVIGRIKSKENVILASKKLVKAILEDETGTIVLNLWGKQADQCRVGDLVRVRNAYVKRFRGMPELNTWEDIEVLDARNKHCKPAHLK
ncbi:MAG: OB-fold nucleic acid binding domain-containing protein [Candidatus Methanomethylicaceae archaeon]